VIRAINSSMKLSVKSRGIIRAHPPEINPAVIRGGPEGRAQNHGQAQRG